MAAVTNWFRKKVGLAIGILSSGFGLGGILVPIVTRLIDALQWRMAMMVVGLGMLAVVLPLSLLVRHKPEDYGQQPDGEVSSAVETMETHVSTAKAEINIPAKRALRNRAFWHVAIGMMCHTFVLGAIVTHIMPYLSSIGITRAVSSLVAFILPVASIGGRLSSGWLSGIFGNRRVFTAGFILMTIGLVLFSYVSTGNMWLLLPFVITYSLGWGCLVTLRISLLREYFGRGNFGTILGFSSGLMMLGMISGAPIAGWIFDTWGRYQGAWLSFCVFSLAGAVLAYTAPSTSHTIQMPDYTGT